MAKRRAKKNRKKAMQRQQGELFSATGLFPVRRAGQGARAVDLSLRIKTAMGRALKECPDSAAVLAARMTEITGREISADALYAYTAPSKPEHDIGIVRHVSDRIAVMHEGKIVEEGPADQVCERPSDAYTKKLLAAVPVPDPREARARRQTIGSA